MRVCARCGIPKPPEAFYDGRNKSYCRVCLRAYTLEWRKRFPGRRRAHVLVARALKDGVLKRPNVCARCATATYTVAHHEDYRRPLKVVWLCDTCHGVRHVELGRRLPRANGAKGGRPKGKAK